MLCLVHVLAGSPQLAQSTLLAFPDAPPTITATMLRCCILAGPGLLR